MPQILCSAFSAAHHFLAQLRDVSIQKDRHRFRSNLRRLGFIMAYEISRTLPHTSIRITTPLGTAMHEKAETPVLIAIMRAALPFLEGFQDVFDDADTGFIGAYRKEGEGQGIHVNVDYLALPVLFGRDVILIDPMLATGTSLADVVRLLHQRFNIRSLQLATLIAAPEGVAYVEKMIGSDTPLWTFQLDEGLNAESQIIPGLGDAGDLSFGQKC